jgi:hypothetical protein
LEARTSLNLVVSCANHPSLTHDRYKFTAGGREPRNLISIRWQKARIDSAENKGGIIGTYEEAGEVAARVSMSSVWLVKRR